jgi:hypothetical protein
MSEIKFLNLAGLSQYNDKIQAWVLGKIDTKIGENNDNNAEDIAKGVSAYKAWAKFLAGSEGATLNLADITTKLSDITGDIEGLEANKADKATTLAGYGITDAYTKDETDAELAKKADKATTLAGYGITDAYTKDETDAELAKKADKATTLEGYGIADAYTKDETDAELAKKADKATTLEGYGITDAYTKTEVDTIKTTIDAYTVNGKAINTNPVLYAGDIAMSNTDATTVKAEIEGLKGAIAGGVHFIGVETTLPNTANNGDIVIVGNKEYIWDEEMTSPSESTYKWIELGDTTAELQRLTALEGKMTTAEADIDALEGRMTTAEADIDALEAAIDAMDASFAEDATATGLVADEIAVVTGVNLTQVDGVITELTVDSAKAATTKYVDDKVSGIATSYVKSFGGKTGDITLSAEGNVTLEMVDNALKASIATITADDIEGLDWD